MATLLGTTFSTDEQVVAKGDVTCIGKVVESLVVEFDQAKYEEFLSSSSKSPKARQYRKVSSEIRSQIPSEASPNAVCAENIVVGCITHKARVNVSHETREVSVMDGQLAPASPLPQLQVTGVPNNP